jgi:mRNA interferase MazF
MALFCPITSREKGYPFEVCIPPGLPVSGVILADHIKNMDWQARHAEFTCTLPQDITNDVLAKLHTLL